MVNLGLPHLTVLSKCDKITDKSLLKKMTKKTYDLSENPALFKKEGEEEMEEELDKWTLKHKNLSDAIRGIVKSGFCREPLANTPFILD